MAVDNRPFKSKEQDGQGNEVIIRDQQLVEQGTTTTMPDGTYFQTLDVDGRPVKISKDNMLSLIMEGLGIIFNGQSDQQTVTKVPTLNGNNFGASTVATLASVLGVRGYGFNTGIRAFDNPDKIFDPGLYTYLGSDPIGIGSNSGGIVEVIRDTSNTYNYTIQRVTLYDAAHKNQMYQRTHNNGWSTWKQLLGVAGIDFGWIANTAYPGSEIGRIFLGDSTNNVEIIIKCGNDESGAAPRIAYRSCYKGTTSAWKEVAQ